MKKGYYIVNLLLVLLFFVFINTVSFAEDDVKFSDKFHDQSSYCPKCSPDGCCYIFFNVFDEQGHVPINNFLDTFERLIRVVVEIVEAYPLAEMFFNLSVGNWSYFIDVAIFTYAKLVQFDFGIVHVILDTFIRLFWEFFSQGFVYQVESGMIFTESQLLEGSFLKKFTYSNIVIFDMVNSWNQFLFLENIDISEWQPEDKFRHFVEFTFWNQQNRLLESVNQ